jgi:hypothetical protein
MTQDATPLGRSLTRGQRPTVRNVSRSCVSLRGATKDARQRQRGTTGSVAPSGGDDRADRFAHLASLLRDLGYGCRSLLRTDARRPWARRDCCRLRGDRGELGSRGKARAATRRDAPIIRGNAEGRRTRLSSTIPANVAGWLRRVVHVHAQLCHTVGLYGDSRRAGGSGLEGDCYAARAQAGDSSILDDTLSRAIEELTAIRDEVWRHMGEVPPSRCRPGTAEKIAELQRRCGEGKSLHHPADARID